MDEWHVGDPADWGDFVGVPDIAYMDYLYDDDEDEEGEYYQDNNHESSDTVRSDCARVFGLRAWKSHEKGNDEEALIEINKALDCDRNHSNNLNMKGIILECLGRDDEAISYYNKSLGVRWSKIVVENKATLIKEWADKVYNYGGDYEKLANLLEDAIYDLSLLESTDEDIEEYKYLRDSLNYLKN